MASVAIPATVTQLIRLATSLSPEIVTTLISKAVELASEVLKTGLSLATAVLKAVVAICNTGVDGVVKLAGLLTSMVVEIVKSGERVILGLADMVARGIEFSPSQSHQHAQ